MNEESIHQLRLPYPGREDRLVRVFVPAHEEGETFPVIYMTDGQNLFDKESSGFGCWYTREAVRDEQAASGKAAVIVGIHNDNPLRECELTPSSIGKPRGPEDEGRLIPAGEGFLDFVVNTVMPAVERRFPVRTGRQNTAFCGSSCGGMMAFFAVLSRPELFCAGGVLSPAFLIFRREDMDRWVHSVLGPEKPFLYLFTGAGDELEKQICESERWTREILRDCYPDERIKEVVLPDRIHHEVAWEPIFRDFLHIFLTRREEY
jgi:predicted alpha/beta superfamily hydrolase